MQGCESSSESFPVVRSCSRVAEIFKQKEIVAGIYNIWYTQANGVCQRQQSLCLGSKHVYRRGAIRLQEQSGSIGEIQA